MMSGLDSDKGKWFLSKKQISNFITHYNYGPTHRAKIELLRMQKSLEPLAGCLKQLDVK